MFLNYDEVSEITAEYGSPVYVYSEEILRDRCRRLINAFEGRIQPSFSVKANTNLSLLKIIREEGYGADAMSPGEVYLLEKAGFQSDEIFYIATTCRKTNFASASTAT